MIPRFVRPFVAAGLLVSSAGCGGGGDPASPTDWTQQVDVVVSDVVPTVVQVSWTSAEPTIGWVAYGPAHPTGLRLPLGFSTGRDPVPTTEHNVLVLGLQEQSRYQLEIWNEGDGEAASTQGMVTETGALPAFASSTLTSAGEGSGAGGFTLASVIGSPADQHLAIFDEHGRYVWAFQPEQATIAPRARLSRDGRSLLYLDSVSYPDEIGALWQVSLDGHDVRKLWELEGAFMDFVEIEPGLVAVIAVELVELDGGARTLAMDHILEIDDQGGKRTLWDAFESLDLDLESTYPMNLFGEGVEIPVHLNSLSYHPEQDMLYTTSAALRAAIAVHRSAGELAWVLAARDGDFEGGEDMELVFDPHSAEWIDGGVLVFDRHGELDGCSGAIAFQLDLHGMQAARSWEYSAEDCVSTDILGNAQPLWNGNTMLVLAMAGRIDEVTPGGEVVWRMDSGFGTAFAYAERFESFYR